MVRHTVERIVCGLLGLYEVTRDDLFKAKAQDIMEQLLPAYNGQSGMFSALFNPKTDERQELTGMGKRVHCESGFTAAGEQRVHRMNHLAYSIPGILTFGKLLEKADTGKIAAHLELASKIMKTCYETYHQQPMGLASDAVSFARLSIRDNQHRLRPEPI